jgi:hypothetical protein
MLGKNCVEAVGPHGSFITHADQAIREIYTDIFTMYNCLPLETPPGLVSGLDAPLSQSSRI